MLNYQRVPYIRPEFQGISPENMTKNMVTYLHGWDAEVPMETMEVSWIPGDSYKKNVGKSAAKYNTYDYIKLILCVINI
jgi:hypothetical protein